MHNLNLSQLKVLDDLSHGYLKKWLGIPQSGSWCLMHDRHGIDIKSVSHLYRESRAVSLCSIRAFGDSRVRHALDSKEAREANRSRKFSSSVFAKNYVIM